MFLVIHGDDKIHKFNVRFKVENGANMSTEFTVYNTYKSSLRTNVRKQFFNIRNFKTIKSDQVDMDMIQKWANQSIELVMNHKGRYQIQKSYELSPLDPRIVVKNIIIPMTMKSRIKFERHTKASWINCYYNYLRAIQQNQTTIDDMKNIRKIPKISFRMLDTPPDDTHCLLDVTYPKEETVDFFVRYNPKRPCQDTIPIAKEFKIKNGFFRMQSTVSMDNDTNPTLNFRIKKFYNDNDPNNYIKWIISVKSLDKTVSSKNSIKKKL